MGLIPQTSVGIAPAAGYAGLVATGNTNDFDTRLADAAVDAGIVVCEGATIGKTCKVPAAATDITGAIGHGRMGVTVFQSMKMPQAAGAVRYAAGDPVPIMRQGKIFAQVVAGQTVAAGDPIFVAFNIAGSNGMVCNTTLTGTAAAAAGWRAHGASFTDATGLLCCEIQVTIHDAN